MKRKTLLPKLAAPVQREGVSSASSGDSQEGSVIAGQRFDLCDACYDDGCC